MRHILTNWADLARRPDATTYQRQLFVRRKTDRDVHVLGTVEDVMELGGRLRAEVRVTDAPKEAPLVVLTFPQHDPDRAERWSRGMLLEVDGHLTWKAFDESGVVEVFEIRRG
jgi:hypothetical protein